jgi:hypothetical protein
VRSRYEAWEENEERWRKKVLSWPGRENEWPEEDTMRLWTKKEQFDGEYDGDIRRVQRLEGAYADWKKRKDNGKTRWPDPRPSPQHRRET